MLHSGVIFPVTIHARPLAQFELMTLAVAGGRRSKTEKIPKSALRVLASVDTWHPLRLKAANERKPCA